MKRLEGKGAIVTGGSVGIGTAIAALFAAEGAHVTIADVDQKAGEAVVREINNAGGKAQFVATDVSLTKDVRNMVESAASFGIIDILVNNAGIMVEGSVVTTDEEVWDKVIAINLKGVYLCSKYALPHIVKRAGVVINMASVAGLYGIRGRAVYNAAKGGVVLLTKNMALDFADKGVRVNSICPGATVTPQFEGGIARTADPVAERAKMRLLRPLGRFGEPNEVAKVALFLATDASSYVSGTEIVVDGATTAQFAGQVRPGM